MLSTPLWPSDATAWKVTHSFPFGLEGDRLSSTFGGVTSTGVGVGVHVGGSGVSVGLGVGVNFGGRVSVGRKVSVGVAAGPGISVSSDMAIWVGDCVGDANAVVNAASAV